LSNSWVNGDPKPLQQYSPFFVKASESDEQSIARELTEEGNMV